METAERWVALRIVKTESLGSLAAGEVQTSVKFEAAPSPVCGERVAEGRVRGRLPTEALPWWSEVIRGKAGLPVIEYSCCCMAPSFTGPS